MEMCRPMGTRLVTAFGPIASADRLCSSHLIKYAGAAAVDADEMRPPFAAVNEVLAGIRLSSR
jgi:hypothetical protein